MTPMLDFAITGLPRSRTAWLSAFLTTDSAHCWHEWSAKVNGPADFLDAIVPGKVSGVSDTGIWLLGDNLKHIARSVVIVHRPTADCEASLKARFGVDFDLGLMADELAKIDGLHVSFDDLNSLECVAQIWEYCTKSPLQRERYSVFKDIRIDTMVDWSSPSGITGTWLARETAKWRQ